MLGYFPPDNIFMKLVIKTFKSDHFLGAPERYIFLIKKKKEEKKKEISSLKFSFNNISINSFHKK